MSRWSDERVDGVLRQLTPTGSGEEQAEGSAGDHPGEGELLAWQTGELDDAPLQQLESHLARCRGCRELAFQLTQPVEESFRRWAGEQLIPRRGGSRVRHTAWAGGALAAAAVVALLVWLPGNDQALPAAYTLEGPLGGVQQLRRAAAAPSDLFLPTSQLQLFLRPSGDAVPERPVAVRAFVSRPGQPLVMLPDRLLVQGEGGVWVLEGSGQELFGSEPGPRTLHLALSASPRELEGLGGLPPAQARRHGKTVRWLEAGVRYATEGEAGVEHRPAER